MSTLLILTEGTMFEQIDQDIIDGMMLNKWIINDYENDNNNLKLDCRKRKIILETNINIILFLENL